jgi:hypothetical protein
VLRDLAAADDVVLVLGAGDVDELGRRLVAGGEVGRPASGGGGGDVAPAASGGGGGDVAPAASGRAAGEVAEQ